MHSEKSQPLGQGSSYIINQGLHQYYSYLEIFFSNFSFSLISIRNWAVDILILFLISSTKHMFTLFRNSKAIQKTITKIQKISLQTSPQAPLSSPFWTFSHFQGQQGHTQQTVKHKIVMNFSFYNKNYLEVPKFKIYKKFQLN